MDSEPTSRTSGQEGTGVQNGQTALDRLVEEHATVERPELVEDGATVDVVGTWYDDEPGRVEVRARVDDETSHLTFAASSAARLSARLATAAAHAGCDR